MVEAIINFLDAIYPMSDPLKEALREIIICDIFPKNHLLLRAGQKCEHVYFIKRGLLKIFTKTGKRDRIIWLLKEYDIAIAVDSFFKQLPGDEYIETLEETELGYISYDQLRQLCIRFPEFDNIEKYLIRHYYLQKEERYKTAHLCAEDRFEFFLDTQRDLLGRVPLKHIASYLGLTQETLSRLKAGKF